MYYYNQDMSIGSKNSQSIKFWGVPISKIRFNECVNLIIKYAGFHLKKRIYCCSLNEIIDGLEDKNFLEALLEADILVPDGTPLVFFLKRHHFPAEKIRATNLMSDVLKASENLPIRHLFFGSDAKTLIKLKHAIKRKFPGFQLLHFISAPYQPAENFNKNIYINEINRIRPNILWLGLGEKKQVMVANYWKDRLIPCVVITVGAAFDFFSGSKTQAPNVIQNVGFEWMFRLFQEPKRLGRRYLNISTKLFFYLAKYGFP